MKATENQGSFLNRISIRRNQVVSMDGNQEQDIEDLEIFQKHVAERFSNLLEQSSSSNDNNQAQTDSSPSMILSIAFLRKLLDAFLCCEAEFKALLIDGRDPPAVSKPPLDRLLPELMDRSVRAMDVCNAVTHGVEAVRHCQKLAEIAVAAIAVIGDSQARRARKALGSLAAAMAVDDEYGSGSGSGSGSAGAVAAAKTERAWSFGRRGGGGSSSSSSNSNSNSSSNKDRCLVQVRSAWWGMGKGWSAAKQIQLMSVNLAPPKGAGGGGGAEPVFVMSAVTAFVMYVLAAAIPCQERSGLANAAAAHLAAAAKQSAWAQPIAAMQEKISEEWKKKERQGSAGLLDELQRMERSAAALAEFTENYKPSSDSSQAEEAAAELAEACRKMEEGLVPLQQQIREVFHKLVKTRTEVLHVLDQGAKLSAHAM